MRYTLDFHESSDPAVVVGKGFGLHRLNGCSMRVPPGFVVTTIAYDSAAADRDVAGAIKNADTGQETAIYDAVMALGLDRNFMDELADRWEEMVSAAGGPLRVSVDRLRLPKTPQRPASQASSLLCSALTALSRL